MVFHGLNDLMSWELVSPILQMLFKTLLVLVYIDLSYSQTEFRDKELNLPTMREQWKFTVKNCMGRGSGEEIGRLMQSKPSL